VGVPKPASTLKGLSTSQTDYRSRLDLFADLLLCKSDDIQRWLWYQEHGVKEFKVRSSYAAGGSDLANFCLVLGGVKFDGYERLHRLGTEQGTVYIYEWQASEDTSAALPTIVEADDNML